MLMARRGKWARFGVDISPLDGEVVALADAIRSRGQG